MDVMPGSISTALLPAGVVTAEKGRIVPKPADSSASTFEGNRGRFLTDRGKTGGRTKGTPNKASRALKEFLAEVLARADVQDAILQRILK